MSRKPVAICDFLEGGGEMGALMRAYNWSKTPIGGQEGWSLSLRTALGMLLNTGLPMYIAWGPQFIQFYNDAYRPILGKTKHPDALGNSTVNSFPEIWDFIGPMFQDVLERGTASTYVDQLLPLDRNSYLEECYFTFSYSAIRTEEGAVGGVLVTCLETTERVLRERRSKLLRDLLDMRDRSSLNEICASAAAILDQDRQDIPFAILYSAESSLEALGACGPAVDDRLIAGLRSFAATRLADQELAGRLHTLDSEIEAAPEWVWPEPITKVVTVPIRPVGRTANRLILLSGLSPRLEFGASYAEFLHSVAQNTGNVIAQSEAYQHERKKAQELAELDQAKTLFFSNISHEFRTPLTLMLGPVEDILNDRTHPIDKYHYKKLDLAHRNAVRLLKLVNALLDFSRIESGRMEAAYAPIDLAAFTAEIASAFQSAVEHAGLKLIVDCPPLSEAIYVDREMWEKILLNLLSNAFKFTFEGEIAVRLRLESEAAVLTVRDTGTGIAPEHLPHLFERFYRVPNVKSRSHEGSGIGLALVHQLVEFQGGEITVESAVGLGTSFAVRLRRGCGHLPADRIEAQKSLTPTTARIDAFVDEALRSVHDEPAIVDDQPGSSEAANARPATVLWADDNADMREYVRRLLSPYWKVEAVADGRTALECALRNPPDIVLTDVMMAHLDGFGLLRELRADPRTRTLPVILLSARAGEEAKIEGLHAGADDYLIKPFSARELIARIRANLEMSRIRNEFTVKQHESDAWLGFAVKAARLGTWYADPSTWDVGGDAHMMRILGLPLDRRTLSTSEWFELIHPEDRGRVIREFSATAAGHRPLDVEFRVRQQNGAVRWLASHGDLISGVGRSTGRIVGVSQDITEQKSLMERQQLLLNELNHRVRNTLATVISLARQTGTGARTVEDFVAKFQARILALSGAHGLLTRRNWETVSLRDVIAETLAAHQESGSLRITGPECDLYPRHALALTLGFHELATNACKYGALSLASGRIEVVWDVVLQDRGKAVRLTWSERGGPPVHPPKRRGFGSTLLERALALDLGGQVSLDFAPPGVECNISFLVEEEKRDADAFH